MQIPCYVICVEVTLALFSLVCVWAIRRQVNVARTVLEMFLIGDGLGAADGRGLGLTSRIEVPPSSVIFCLGSMRSSPRFHSLGAFYYYHYDAWICNLK